ncbi:MAG TPA: cell division protein FtsA [Chloroflexia bacterium]|nr:cell division protein FtsA [Chloroflexia bacterium]
MASKQDKLIVGLDVGTTKCCAIIGEVTRDSHINILGFGSSPTTGLQKGVVVNIDQASASISAAIEMAERQAGLKVDKVFVGVTGSHVSSVNSRGVVAVAKSNRDITYEDVGRALDSARSVSIPSQREVLHVIPRTYVIDGQDGVRDPVGMSGYRLEVETHIVTGAISALNNLFKAVQRTGVEVDELVLQPLAASEAVLSDAEKRLGVCLIDIGAGTTDIAIYIDGSIWHTAVLPVGGNHITNDLSIVLRTSPGAAEQLKVKHGDASVTGPYKGLYADYYGKGPLKHDFRSRLKAEAEGTGEETAEGEEHPDQMLEAESLEPGKPHLVSRNLLNEVIHARVRQLFDMVQAEIKKSGYDGMIPAGLVVTGGTSTLQGITDAAGHVLRMPVRIGVPRGLSGLADSLGGPAYASSVGLMLWGLNKRNNAEQLLEANRRGGKNSMAVGRKFGGWLREFLP